MSDTHLVIFSRGRVGKQRTLSYLPDSLKRNDLTFVCPKSEMQDHRKQDYAKGLNIVPWKDGVHLADKRLGVAKYLDKQGVKQFLYMDDDVALSTWMHKEKTFRSTRLLKDDGEQVTRVLLKHTDRMFKEYIGVGYGCLSMQARMDAIKNNILKVENKKMCCMFGYRTKEFLALVDHPRFASMWGIDTTWNLEMMTKGHNIVTDYSIAWTTDFKSTVGGAASYRTKPAVAHSFLRMMLLHPGLISRGRDGVHVHSFLRISWKDIPNFGGRKLSTKGANNFFAELKHQNTNPKEFLRGCPSDSREWYAKRIEKLGTLL